MERPQQLQAARVTEKPPKVGVETIYELLPSNLYRGVNVRPFLEAISDESIFLEYKRDYARGCGDNVIAGKMLTKRHHCRGDCGQPDGHNLYRSGKEGDRMDHQVQPEKVPLLFVQSSPGYMIGTESEHMGIGKYGADMVRAVSCAQVPRIQLVIGPDNGAANYGMCGRAYRPHFLFSTMRARTSVMSGKSAGEGLLSLEEKKRADSGKPMSDEEKRAFREEMIAKYDGEAHPFFCASRLLSDRVLKFNEIRDWLAMALELSLLIPTGEPCFGNLRF